MMILNKERWGLVLSFDVKEHLSDAKSGITGFFQQRKKDREMMAHSRPLRRSPLLKSLVGKHAIVFHSDYMEIDNHVAQILTIIDREGSDRDKPKFWMTYLIPRNLNGHVEARFIMPIETMTEAWTDNAQTNSEVTKNSQMSQAAETDASKDAQIANARAVDLQLISADLNAGDKYLATQLKIFLKADNLAALDAARVRLNQTLISYNFGGIRVVPFEGQQLDEFENLLKPPMEHISKPQMFTSHELAGAYNLLTHGITDPAGKYVGAMQADVNNSAVLLDVDKFDDTVVVASKDAAQTASIGPEELKGNRNSTLWGVKIAQSALENSHRVVHFVLNYTHPDKLGADLSDISQTLDMNQGMINPFQMFGKFEDQLSVYSAHNEMLRLMAQQISSDLQSNDLNKVLPALLKRFYIQFGIWQDNPKENFDLLRAVSLRNRDYPKLDRFNTYLGEALQAALQRNAANEVASIERLQGVFERMEGEDSDLFNVYTSKKLTDAKNFAQVFYDFSKLLDRSESIAMAQLLNVIGYATSNLGDHDVLIIHGANAIRNSVKQYLTKHVFTRLQQRGVRLVFLYDSVDSCLEDASFCRLDHADYTLFGTMTGSNVEKYQQLISQPLPAPLMQAIETKIPTLFFLSRGIDKVIFIQDLVLK